MYEQTERINAAISYLFLGPLFLFAKKNTPFAHPFVQAHAKQASKIIGLGIIGIGIYVFIREYLTYGLFGISLQWVILGIFMTVFLGTLLLGGYNAFRGKEAKTWLGHIFAKDTTQFIHNESYTQEDKAQIIASFIPFFGIFIAEKNARSEIIIGRKVSNFFVFLMIVSLILWGEITTIFFLLSLGFISLVVTTGVYLFATGKFLVLFWYQYIPTYHALEAHFYAFFVSVWQWFRMAFWAKQSFTYQQKFQEYLTRFSQKHTPTHSYWTHPVITAIPIINIITIPSLFQKQYREYRPLIIEGLALTLLCLIVFFLFRGNAFLLYLLLFPFFTLLAKAKHEIYIRAPITSFLLDIVALWFQTQHILNEQQKQENITTFRYTDTQEEHTTDTPKTHTPEEHTPQKIQKSESGQ